MHHGSDLGTAGPITPHKKHKQFIGMIVNSLLLVFFLNQKEPEQQNNIAQV